jgi:hypothetical protein
MRIWSIGTTARIRRAMLAQSSKVRLVDDPFRNRVAGRQLIRIDGLCALSRKMARRSERALPFGPSWLAKAKSSGRREGKVNKCEELIPREAIRSVFLTAG